MALLGGCKSATTPVVCSSELIYAIDLTVRDSTTGAYIADGAVLTALFNNGHGTSPVTGWNRPVNTDILIGSNPGTYDLLLKKSGYSDWTRNDVSVASADALGCQPVTLALTA